MSARAPDAKSGDHAPAAPPAVKSRKATIIKVVFSIVALTVAGIIAKQAMMPVASGLGEVESLWFYDIESAKLTALPDAIPPVKTATGRAVRAYVYGCGGCSDPEKLVTAYYETFNPETQASLIAGKITTYSELASEPRDTGRLVSNDPKGNWYAANSREGQAVTSGSLKCPDGNPAKKLCLGPNTR